jgi:hypothetical protein
MKVSYYSKQSLDTMNESNNVCNDNCFSEPKYRRVLEEYSHLAFESVSSVRLEFNSKNDAIALKRYL